MQQQRSSIVKFSDVPEDSYFVVINAEKAVPIFFKSKERKIELQIGFLQCRKQIDSSNFDIAPSTEVQLIKL